MRRQFARCWVYLILPIVTVVIFAGLVAFQLSGSSVAVLDKQYSQDPGLIVGKPRSIRSDEFLYTTPLQISQARTGFPNQKWIGLSDVQTPVVSTLATNQYIEIFRPYNWGYHLFGPSFGLAWSWWMSIVLSILGLYFLAVSVRAGPLLASAVALIGTFNPYTGWWTSTQPNITIAGGAFAAAFVIWAVRAKRWWAVLLCAVGAAYALACAFFGLYPPWSVSVSFVAALAALGVMLDERTSWKRILLIGGYLIPMLIISVVPWAKLNSDGLAAIANTDYPGRRMSDAGEFSLWTLLDAPANVWFSLRKTVNFDGSNLSEASSVWFPLLVIVVGVVVALVAGSKRWAVALTAAATGFVLVWAVVPIPSIIGHLLGFGFVPGKRAPLALGFGAVLILLFVALALKGRRLAVWSWVLLGVAVVGSILGSFAVIAGLPIRGATPNLAVFVLGAVVLALGFGLLMFNRWRVVATVGLVGYCLVSYGLINPLYQGIGPLADGGVTDVAQTMPPGTKVAFIGRNATVRAQLSASQMQLMSGLTPYPDAELMEVVAPGQRKQWNSYTSYFWVLNPDLSHAVIRRGQIDSAVIQLDPCAESSKAIGVQWYVTPEQLNLTCLRYEFSSSHQNRSFNWYRVVP